MALNFNVDPYYDDFEETKQFYRILFKPGRAVQARELTQIQSILQNQISRFGNSIYKEGSVVTGAEHSLDDTCFYIKCKTTYTDETGTIDVDFTDIEGNYLVEPETGKIGLIKKYTPGGEVDPPTLHVSIVQGSQTAFNSSSNFYVIRTKTSTNVINRFSSIEINASGNSLLFHINEGVFFANQTFLYCKKDTIVVGKYSKDASYIIGLDINESFVDYVNDSSLLDPALGSSNYLAPGADRYKIDLQLTIKDYTEQTTSYENFIEVCRVKNGNLQSDRRFPLYSNIMDTMARRTYDESGDYIVRNFIPKIKTDYQDDNKLILEIGPGKAYIKGYEVETISPTTISLNKARDSEIANESQISTFYGNYSYVRDLKGELPNLDEAYLVEIHNVFSDQSESTKIGTAYVNNIDYVSGSDANSVYGLFLQDINLTASSFGSTKSFIIPNGTNYISPVFSANVDVSGMLNGTTQLFDSKYGSLLFKTVQRNIKDLTNVEYTYKHIFTGTVSSNTVSITCKSSDSFIYGSSATHYRQNYVIVNTTTGEFIPTDEGLIVNLSSDYQATIDFGKSDYNGDTVKIIATVRTTNDSSVVKTLVSDHAPTLTGSELTVNSVAPISLLKSDVYSLSAVYEFDSSLTYQGTWSSGTTYTNNDVIIFNNVVYQSLQNSNLNRNPETQSSYWSAITNSVNNYILNTGQTDFYYDHGSIARKTKPDSALKVIPVFSYFTHSGVGHISATSYPVNYDKIQTYTSSVSGVSYSLTDVIDFRPRRIDDTTDFLLSPRQKPQPFTNVDSSIEYYLSRVDKVILTSDGKFKLLQGIPSYLNAKPPANQDDAIALYLLTYAPYTSDTIDVNVKMIPYRRYTMKDIANLDDRVSRVEYYTSLSLLEKEVTATTIFDDNGVVLYKNGFLVDSFKGHNVGDVYNPEYRSSIDYTNTFLRPLYLSNHSNFNYIRSNSTTQINSTLVTVPFVESIYISQPIASNYMSVNPFNVVSFIGRLQLSPESDTWFDTTTVPNIVVNVDGQNDNYAGWSSIETQWNAWETIWSGEKVLENTKTTVVENSREITRATVEVTQKQTRTGYEVLQAPPSTVISTSTNIVSEEVIPYTRTKDISFDVTGMAPNIPLYLYINGLNMSNYLKPRSLTANGTSNVYPTMGITTDNSGSASGVITFPNNENTKFMAGRQNIVLSDNPFDHKMSVSFASSSYFSQGLLQKTQTTVYSTKSGYEIRRNLTDNRINVTTQTKELSNVAIIVDVTPNASYTLIADKSEIKEGNTVSFVFTAQNAPAGKKYSANLQGSISSSQMSGYALGDFVFTTSGTQALNTAYINIPISINPSSNENKWLKMNVNLVQDANNLKLGPTQTLSSNVIITDVAVATYSASAPKEVGEGNTLTVTLSGNNLKNNELISYAVSGTVNANDYTGNSSTGSFTLSSPSSTKTLNFNITSDLSTEGTETFIVTYTLPDGTTTSTTTNVLDTSVSVPISYTLNGPSSVNEGDTITFTVTTTNPVSNTSDWTLLNPSGVWLTSGQVSGTTINITGENDWSKYVDAYNDVLELYEDGLNGTTLYSQDTSINNKIFATAQDQYKAWVNNSHPFKQKAFNGKSVFGQWHYDSYGKSQGRTVPISSLISGTATVSSSNPVKISLIVNPDKRQTGSRTVTLNIFGQTKNVIINDTSLKTLPSLDPTTKKIVGNGDFVDSHLTISQALTQYTYDITGKTYQQIISDPSHSGKFLIKPENYALRDSFGATVVSWYRNQSTGLNRNPDLAGFIWWVNTLLTKTLTPSSVWSPEVYAVGPYSGVWVNPGTDTLVEQWQTRYRNITIPSTGTYTISLISDDGCWVHMISSDGTQTYLMNHDFRGGTNPTPTQITIPNMTAGNYVFKFESKNGNYGSSWNVNPAFWSMSIVNSFGGEVWNTRMALAGESVAIGPSLSQSQALIETKNIFDISAANLNEPIGSRANLPFLACTTDPLAQTFFVSENAYPQGLFLTSASLFFKGKDENLPVFLEIRPTENGYPSSTQIVPMATVSLNPNQVNISDDASVETKFPFKDPIYLSPGEYSIVVGSNSDQYTVFYGEVGAKQINTNSIISSQPYVGSLFKSQNASTWTPDQSMDLCFKLYKAKFDVGTYTGIFETSAPTKDSNYNKDNPFSFHTIKLISEEIDFNSDTDINYEIKNQYQELEDSTYKSIISNKNYNLGETKEFGPTPSSKLRLTLKTTNQDISPVVDMERLSLIMIQNIINSENDVIVPEIYPQGGNSSAKYVTRYVTLADGFDATGLRVLFDINRPFGTSVKVYAKVKASDDTDSFDNKYWQEISKISVQNEYSSEDEYLNSEYKVENISYISNGVTYYNFKIFAIKIVMYSTDKAFVPLIKNLRVIATS